MGGCLRRCFLFLPSLLSLSGGAVGGDVEV